MIAVLPSDLSGVGWYRLGLPAAVLAAQGARVVMFEGIPMEDDRSSVALRDDLGLTALVMQRPTAMWQLVAIRDLQRKGVRVVVDLDDDFHSLGPGNVAFEQLRAAGSGESLATLREACRLADLVTVSTPALAKRYGGHGRVRVLPNYVSASWTGLDVEPDLDVVGWTGTIRTHRGDLAVTRGGVGAAVRDLHKRFCVIGQPGGVQAELGLDKPPECVSWLEIDEYPVGISRFGVGIAPLADTAFNRAKSWVKPLEMAACGVPCVMSPTVEYERLHRFGVGVLAASRARNWKREVGRLLADRGLRAELSARGRAVVAEQFVIERHAWRWLEAWSN